MLAQIFWHGFTIGEVSCPTKYFKEASSINFRRSVKYGFGCLAIGLKFRLAKMGLRRPRNCSVQRRGEARFLPVDGGAGEHAGFDGLVECGMDAGQQFDGFVLFAVSEQRAIIFFQAVQARFDAAIVLVLALVAARPAFG
jgi:hypothetical protein